MNVRKITSLTMLVSFVLLMLTSVILYIEPDGRVAYWSEWRLFGLTKEEWGDQHINLGVLFLLAGFLHISFNWKVITAYLRNRARQVKVFTPSFSMALVVSLVVVLGTYFRIPPMSTVLAMGEAITRRANEKYGEPPYGHAELSSLKIFAKRLNLDLDRCKELLAQAGIKEVADSEAIGEIAQKHAITPKQLLEIIKPAEIKQPEAAGFPDSPPAGFGSQTLAEICAEFDLHIPSLLKALEKEGLKADAAQTVKEIGEANDRDPMSIFEILHAFATGA